MVKTAMKPLTEREFIELTRSNNLLALQGGSLKDINIFRVDRSQLHGSGILNTLASIGRFILPAMKKYVAPASLEFSKGVFKDVIRGKKIKDSLKKRGVKSLKRIGSKILQGKGKNVKYRKSKHIKKKFKKTPNQGCGSNSKQKSLKKNNKRKSKKRYNDIFS